LVFPEISADALDRIFGLQVSLVTNAGTDAPTQEMLKAFHFPLRLEK
jgi:large subunit ribosomal protein L5